jgi:hypothetical protein
MKQTSHKKGGAMGLNADDSGGTTSHGVGWAPSKPSSYRHVRPRRVGPRRVRCR